LIDAKESPAKTSLLEQTDSDFAESGSEGLFRNFAPRLTASNPPLPVLGVGASRVRARALWYLLSAFAVISYTGNSIYVIFAATGSWIGAYFSVRWLDRANAKLTPGGPAALGNPPA